MPSPETETPKLPALVRDTREEVERTLSSFLEHERSELAEHHETFLPLFDEVVRMVRAGGKRIRPILCCLGFRAAGGSEHPGIARVAAGLELFHTFALIHDDVMDRSASRRGEPTIHTAMAARHDEQFGVSSAVLAGDLALVLGDQLFLDSGFPPEVLVPTFRRYNAMRVQVAVGQFLDIAGSAYAVDEGEALAIAALKSGSYTVVGPLLVGASLADASGEVTDALSRFGVPLGEAFQIRNDIEDALGSGLDLAQARPTVLLAKARELASPEDRRFLDRRLGHADLSPSDLERALRIVTGSGAVEAADELASELVTKAIKAVSGAPFEPQAADGLRWVAQLVARL